MMRVLRPGALHTQETKRADDPRNRGVLRVSKIFCGRPLFPSRAEGAVE
jgi:hypothetical protein